MKYLAAFFIMVLTLGASSSASALPTSGSDVCFGPDNKYSGFLVHPGQDGTFPGIVVIHEWWGLNDHIKGQASLLAAQGYVVLAVDLFGKVAATPEEARQQTQNLKQEEATAELLAAANYLRSLPYVPDNKVGSLGWCFGGRQSLILAINDPKLAAAVIYYGQPILDLNQIAKIKAPLLLIYGEADESIPMSQVNAFTNALNQTRVSYELYTYAGAGHAFANPSRGDAYKPVAAKDAWEKTLAFLNRNLKQ